MTTPSPQPQPSLPQRDPIPTAPMRRRVRLWIAAAVVIGLCILAPLIYLQTGLLRRPGPSAQAVRQRQALLELGAALKQYATQHDGALPDQVPSGASPAAAGAIYRAVTPAGERLRYETFGERVVAWTDPDESGRRLVLLNSLDEAEYVAAAQLHLNEQRRLDAGGDALNRVRKVSVAEEEEDEAVDDSGEASTTAESTSSPTTAPGTAPTTAESR
jgi:hypothetical protein